MSRKEKKMNQKCHEFSFFVANLPMHIHTKANKQYVTHGLLEIKPHKTKQKLEGTGNATSTEIKKIVYHIFKEDINPLNGFQISTWIRLSTKTQSRGPWTMGNPLIIFNRNPSVNFRVILLTFKGERKRKSMNQ